MLIRYECFWEVSFIECSMTSVLLASEELASLSCGYLLPRTAVRVQHNFSFLTLKIKLRKSSLIIPSYIFMSDINIVPYATWGFSKESCSPLIVESLIIYHFINTTEEKPLMQAGLSIFENKCTRHQNAYVRIT